MEIWLLLDFFPAFSGIGKDSANWLERIRFMYSCVTAGGQHKGYLWKPGSTFSPCNQRNCCPTPLLE